MRLDHDRALQCVVVKARATQVGEPPSCWAAMPSTSCACRAAGTSGARSSTARLRTAPCASIRPRLKPGSRPGRPNAKRCSRDRTCNSHGLNIAIADASERGYRFLMLRPNRLCAALLAASLGLDVRAATPTYPPERAAGEFSSANYAVTFPAPPDTFYCPIPNDWTGSDHGTVIFLERPTKCYRPGYPSSSRGFDPGVPHIEIYYGLNVSEYVPPRCRAVDRLELMGSRRPLCRLPDPKWIVLSVSTTYQSFDTTDFDATLVTTRARFTHDLDLFRRFVAAVRTCKDGDASLKGAASTWGTWPSLPEGRLVLIRTVAVPLAGIGGTRSRQRAPKCAPDATQTSATFAALGGLVLWFHGFKVVPPG